MSNMTIGQKIKYLRKRKEISQVSFADNIGVSKQTLYKYENDIITNIPSDKIEAIAKICNVSPAYLMGWADETPLPPNIFPMPEMKKVPLLGTIACGEPVLAVENIEDYVNMESNIHADFALRCKGDSMINARILPGDIVFIRKQDTVENGEIAAVLVDGVEPEATLKKVFFDADCIRLHAENPMYTDMFFTGEKINVVRIIGKAVAFFSEIR